MCFKEYMEKLKVTKTEKEIRDIMISQIDLLFITGVLLFAVWVRWSGLNLLSGDYRGFLEPWFFQIRANGGLAGLKEQIGDYNLAYQTVIAILTYFPVQTPLYLYKGFSILFDLVLAAAAADLYHLASGREEACCLCICGSSGIADCIY